MKRITVSLDNNIYSMLRKFQAKLIGVTEEEWSLASVVNFVLLMGFMTPDYIPDSLKNEFYTDLFNRFYRSKEIIDEEAERDRVINEIMKKLEKAWQK